MRKNILVKYWALTLLPLALAASICFGSKSPEPVSAADPIANHFFAQSMPDTTGRTHPFTQWRGKTLLVNFWATWCTPCVKEMPELSALQTEVARKNIQIIGVGIDSKENISTFSSKYAISYPLYVAGTAGTQLLGELGNRVGGLPFSLLIGRDGQIKKTYLGGLKMDELRNDLISIDAKRF